MTRVCRNYRGQVNSWPRNHVTFDEILQHYISEFEKNHGGCLSEGEKNQLREGARSMINSQVLSINNQIDQQNENALSQIATFLSQNFSVPSVKLDELRNFLSNYLRSSQFEEGLVNFLINIESENKARIATSLESQFPDRRKINSGESWCTYVPTAFCSPTKSRLIYGGVLLQARPVFNDQVSQRGQGCLDWPLKSHGSSYKRATVLFKKITMEDPNAPSHIRGFLRNEIRRTNGDWYKVRNPPGFDIDHTFDDVRFCRWKDINMNRSTSSVAERIRTRAQGPAFEFDQRISEIMNKRKADYIDMGLCVKGKKETFSF